MSNPEPILPSPTSPQPGHPGSLLAGFLLGWAAMIAGVVCNGVFWSLQSSMGLPGADIVYLGVGTLPLLGLIAVAVWFSSRGKSRSVRGVLLAFGSLAALVLLLVAACFGILATGGFGNMH